MLNEIAECNEYMSAVEKTAENKKVRIGADKLIQFKSMTRPFLIIARHEFYSNEAKDKKTTDDRIKHCEDKLEEWCNDIKEKALDQNKQEQKTEKRARFEKYFKEYQNGGFEVLGDRSFKAIIAQAANDGPLSEKNCITVKKELLERIFDSYLSYCEDNVTRGKRGEANNTLLRLFYLLAYSVDRSEKNSGDYVVRYSREDIYRWFGITSGEKCDGRFEIGSFFGMSFMNKKDKYQKIMKKEMKEYSVTSTSKKDQTHCMKMTVSKEFIGDDLTVEADPEAKPLYDENTGNLILVDYGCESTADGSDNHEALKAAYKAYMQNKRNEANTNGPTGTEV